MQWVQLLVVEMLMQWVQLLVVEMLMQWVQLLLVEMLMQWVQLLLFLMLTLVQLLLFFFDTIGSSTTPVSTGNGSCETGEVSPTPDWNCTVEAIKALAHMCMHICCKAPFIRVFFGRRFTIFFTS